MSRGSRDGGLSVAVSLKGYASEVHQRIQQTEDPMDRDLCRSASNGHSVGTVVEILVATTIETCRTG